MPTVQSTYLDNIPVGYLGAIANEEPRTLISRNVEDVAGIAFGLAVMQGTEDKDCVVSDGSGFLGVTVRDQSVDPAAPNSFEELSEARIMTQGVIWIANSGGVNAGDPVEALAAGALGTSTGGNVANARWDTTAADGELAQLRLVGGAA
jgi:hypothetical protein